MADRLSADEFDRLWRRWLPLCSEEVKSPKGYVYNLFGSDEDEVAAFAMLITILRDEYGYSENDMESAGKKTVELLCPRLPHQTAAKNNKWKELRLKKWNRALDQIFGDTSGLSEKYKLEDFKKDIKDAPTPPPRQTQSDSTPEPVEPIDSETLPNRPPVPKGIGDKNPPTDIVDEDADILAELGVKR